MGKHVKRIASAVAAALAAIAAHTSFATDVRTSAPVANGYGGAGGAGGHAVGIGQGVGQGGNAASSQTVNGGSTRAFGLGLGAAANATTCMYPTLGGAMQNQEDLCAVIRESYILREQFGEKAGRLHLCSLNEMRTTILAVHGPRACDGIPLRNDARAPYFALGGWQGVAADAYGGHVRERQDPAQVGAQ